MLYNIQINNENYNTNVSWQKFVDRISYLIPKTMSDKMTLFLRAIAPQNIPEQDFPNYSFDQSDIIMLCKTALNVLDRTHFHNEDDGNNDFFEEMSINFAKYIYQIINIKWSDTRPIPVKNLQELVKKAN